MPATPVGTLAWERAGGPALSPGQRFALLAGSGAILATHWAGWLRWRFRRRTPPRVDLATWTPPDTAAARDAEAFLREVSSAHMIAHSLRTYYFSAIVAERSPAKPRVDREALYVAALMHDVGLFESAPRANEHCFTVASAREARRIGAAAGWDDDRRDRMAVAITSNLNPFVSAEQFGVEAHLMSLGGRVEILAQEWKIHPDNLAEVLGRYPRTGFAADAMVHVDKERKQNRGCRFACLHPLFGFMLDRSSFSLPAG